MESPIQNEPRFAPVCHACKAQNETLRAVTLPFVFSVVFMTFQRNFSGVYCRKHRRLYYLLASVITSVFGWIGIPFGFVFTPLTLLKLARGGIQNPRENFEVLTAVADKKLMDGDAPAAIRCLEESLRFEDDPEVRRRLAGLYQTNRQEAKLESPGGLLQIWGIFVALALAALLGIFTGFVDALLTDLLFPFYNGNTSIFVAILSWVPFVLLIFLSALVLQSLVGAHFVRNRVPSQSLAIMLSLSVTAVFFYNVLDVQFIFRNILRLVELFSYSSKDGFFALRSILSSGAFFLIGNDIAYSGTVGFIYLALVLAGIGVCLYACLFKGFDAARWQGRLDQVRGLVETREESSALISWGTLAAMLAFPLLVIGLLVPGRVINVERAYLLVQEGMELTNQFEYELAIAKFNQSLAIWPDSVAARTSLGLGRMGTNDYDGAYDEVQRALEIDPQSMGANLTMGFVQMERGEYDSAIEYIETVSTMQPSWAAPHAILAMLYYQMDDNDLAEEQQQQAAVAYSENDSLANGYLAAYFMYLKDFETAEKYALQAIKLGGHPADYVTLARIYAAEKKDDQAEKAIAEAERLGAEPTTIFEVRAALAQNRGDFEAAKAILLEGIKAYPDQSTLFGDLSAVYLDMGQVSKAVEEAQKAVELNQYDGYAYVELAFAYQAQGKTADALEAARTGLRFHPKYDRVHYILGLCYMDSGMTVEAIQEFETFLDLFWERNYMLDEKALAEQYIRQLK